MDCRTFGGLPEVDGGAVDPRAGHLQVATESIQVRVRAEVELASGAEPVTGKGQIQRAGVRLVLRGRIDPHGHAVSGSASSCAVDIS